MSLCTVAGCNAPARSRDHRNSQWRCPAHLRQGIANRGGLFKMAVGLHGHGALCRCNRPMLAGHLCSIQDDRWAAATSDLICY